MKFRKSRVASDSSGLARYSLALLMVTIKTFGGSDTCAPTK